LRYNLLKETVIYANTNTSIFPQLIYIHPKVKLCPRGPRFRKSAYGSVVLLTVCLIFLSLRSEFYFPIVFYLNHSEIFDCIVHPVDKVSFYNHRSKATRIQTLHNADRETARRFLHTHYDAKTIVSVRWLCGEIHSTNNPGAFRFPFRYQKNLKITTHRNIIFLFLCRV
jgi:hypothetical protein